MDITNLLPENIFYEIIKNLSYAKIYKVLILSKKIKAICNRDIIKSLIRAKIIQHMIILYAFIGQFFSGKPFNFIVGLK